MAANSESRVPVLRVRKLNGHPVKVEGKYVLYWMIAARRTRWNFALDRAVELARELDRPLAELTAALRDSSTIASAVSSSST